MNKVLCFGELLLRLSPPADGEWLQQHSLPAFVGGAEANVATALALWEQPVSYCTALPDNFLGKQLAEYLSKKNIDVSTINYSGNRVGLYYLQQGTDVKSSGVVFDRAGSSFASLQKGMIDWDKVLEGISWFHVSAIAASLTASAAEVCEEALQAASEKGITISVDLNYRDKLWQYGKLPVEVMPGLVKYCDLIMGNLWAADRMLGIAIDEDLVKQDSKTAYLQQAKETSKAIRQLYPNVKTVANTFRFDREAGIQYYTTLFREELLVSAEYAAGKALDKVGSGDCFMAGLIYGTNNGLSLQQTLDFATAAAYNKLFIKGDTTDQTVNAITETIQHG
ncbi:MAG TPA: sugar kinase [Ferruginibacter sp.]|jgi:2-dehydro-3-deoxygluconokinase|nr:sugar kinase [Ferruginibacter sp.]